MSNKLNMWRSDIESALQKARSKRLLKRSIALLSVIVIFVTMNQTKSFAETLERIPSCGIEYDHKHDESCYSEDGLLTCRLHEHTDACYQTRPKAEDLDVIQEIEVESIDEVPLDLATVSQYVDAEPLEETPFELGAFMIGEEEEPELIDSNEYETADSSTNNENSYILAEENPVLLSAILSTLGIKETIEEISQVIDDEHPEGMVKFVDVEDDIAIYATESFSDVEIALYTSDDIIVVTLLDAVVEALPEGPTEEPAAEPSKEPTGEPTTAPTGTPEELAVATEEPTDEPTTAPTRTPDEEPTVATEEPTDEATTAPTETPAEEPAVVAEKLADEPTVALSKGPTDEPATAEPSEAPVEESTAEPSEEPTAAQTEAPAISSEKTFYAEISLADSVGSFSLREWMKQAKDEPVEAEDDEKDPGKEADEDAAQALDTTDWIIDYNKELIAIEYLDGDYSVMPLASFENTLVTVDTGIAEYILELTNYAASEVSPEGIRILTLGLAEVSSADAALELPADASGNASILDTTSTEAAQADIEAWMAAQKPMKAKKALMKAPTAVTTETDGSHSQTEYLAFDISLDNVDASDYPEGFRISVNLTESIIGRDFTLYHIHEDEYGKRISRIDDLAIEKTDGVVTGFTFVTPDFSQFVLSYTVEYEIAGDGITVSVDFQNIVQNGVDFGETAILSAVDEGVALNIAQLEAGLADDTLADALNINYTANVNGDSAWDAYEVVSADPGLEVADGEIRVTADGTVVLSDGVSTINIVITGYQASVQKVLGDGATIEALGDTELPMGASAAYEDISDKAEALAETYNLIPEQTEEEKKEIGFSAFDVAVTVPSDDYVAEGSFAVTVPHAIDVEVPENAKVTYELFHIHEVDGEMKAELVENATVEDGKVSFVTDGFPEYVVVYTVNSDSTKKQFTANYDTEISEATKLSAVLDALSIVLPAESGSAIAVTDIDRIESEDDIKLAVRSDGNDWTITPTAAFDSLALYLKLKDDKGSVTINVKSRIKVTVTANTFSKTYGEDDPTFTATVTGLPDGVDESVISYSLTRSEGDNVGTYDITPVGDAEQGDYVINYVGGTLEINPAPVTLTANSDTKPKTGEEIIVESFTCSVNNLIFGEGVTASGRGTEPGMYDVTFEGVTLNETKDTTGNYVVTATQNGLLIITDGDGSNLIKKELTGFNGDLASYKIEINPGKLILNDGEPITIKDTFSNNQSINYGSVKVNISNAETDPSFDYSGYTGTFTVPDGNAVTITYTTRVKGNVGDAVDISNTATLGRVTNRDYASGPSATVSNKVTITPTGSDTSGTDGVYTIRLFAYAEGHMERGLKGAAFRLLDSNMRPMVYKAGAHKGEPIAFTTDKNGYADIALDEAKDGLTIRKNTVYYLEMTAAPFELLGGEYIYYQKDNTYYSFLITDEPSYNYGEIYSYFNGDVLKVRCYPEAGGVNVTKRFGGNYTLTDAQKNAITFTLQKQYGTSWKDVERHAYGEFSYGSVNFDIKASDLEDGAIYRMVETNALPDELEGIVELNATSSVTYQVEGEPVEDESGVFLVDPDDKTQVSYSFTFTN